MLGILLAAACIIAALYMMALGVWCNDYGGTGERFAWTLAAAFTVLVGGRCAGWW